MLFHSPDSIVISTNIPGNVLSLMRHDFRLFVCDLCCEKVNGREQTDDIDCHSGREAEAVVVMINNLRGQI